MSHLQRLLVRTAEAHGIEAQATTGGRVLVTSYGIDENGRECAERVAVATYGELRHVLGY